MLYSDFIVKAMNTVIKQDEDTEIWYLNPEWVDKLHRAGLGNLEDLEDSYITDWLDVEDILKLEVKRRNMIDDKRNYIIDWIYNVLKQKIEPAETDAENEYVDELINYYRREKEPEE